MEDKMMKQKERFKRQGEFKNKTFYLFIETTKRLDRYKKKFPSVNKSEMVDLLINRHLDNLKIK